MEHTVAECSEHINTYTVKSSTHASIHTWQPFQRRYNGVFFRPSLFFGTSINAKHNVNIFLISLMEQHNRCIGGEDLETINHCHHCWCHVHCCYHHQYHYHYCQYRRRYR